MVKHSKLSPFALYPVLTIILCFVPSPVHSATHGADTHALREIRRAIDPNSISPSSYLKTWDFTVDPCESSGSKFLGVLCRFALDNSTSRVTAIDLDGIGYDGFLSPAIGNLSGLDTLNLENNNFRGPIPDTIGNLKKLIRLDMSGNFLTGVIPAQLFALKNLVHLDVSRNKLSGIIPTGISGFRSLTYLSLADNGFEGTIPDLTGLWQLSTIDLSNNQFFGDIPLLPVSLRTLYLPHNILSGHITPLRRLRFLRRIDVSDNRITGFISRDVLSLPNLVHLNISFNRFTTLEVDNYSWDETQLQVFDAKGNHFHGHLPVNLVTFRNLTVINLANNQFSGSVPKEFGAKLRGSWRILYLDHNFLRGVLPSQFSRARIRGSLANNCLSCPSNVVLCHGGQRPTRECMGNNHQL